jgi:hypothetical protein
MLDMAQHCSAAATMSAEESPLMAEPTSKRERRDHVEHAANEQTARTQENTANTRPDHPGMDAALADMTGDEQAQERMSQVEPDDKPNES